MKQTKDFIFITLDTLRVEHVDGSKLTDEC